MEEELEQFLRGETVNSWAEVVLNLISVLLWQNLVCNLQFVYADSPNKRICADSAATVAKGMFISYDYICRLVDLS